MEVCNSIMVTERKPGSKTDSFRTSFANYLNGFATTITRNRHTETKDDMNRVTAVSTASTTYKADIQWVNKFNILHLNLGDVKVGDGLLFLEHDADVVTEDDIVYNSITWRIVEKIEGEQVNGDVIYLGFVIRKNAQS